MVFLSLNVVSGISYVVMREPAESTGCVSNVSAVLCENYKRTVYFGQLN
jgi:hypothetical protein